MTDRNVEPSLFPLIIDLELSNRCNLDCIMCTRLPQKLHMGDMAEALWSKVLDEALEVPERIFRLHGIGEPLLSPSFRTVVERIKGHHHHHSIDLITNGHFLDRNMARFLLRQGVDQITVSVAAASEQGYERVRGSKKFSRVVQNTLRLHDERERMQAPSKIIVQIVDVEPVHDEIDAFVEFWSRFDVQVEVWHDLNRGRRAFNPRVESVLSPCEHLYSYTAVCWDGRVCICCIDGARHYIVGNANTETLREVFNGRRLNAIRRLHEEGQSERMPICADCSFRDGKHVAALHPPASSQTDPSRAETA